jgi:hypothetical protein
MPWTTWTNKPVNSELLLSRRFRFLPDATCYYHRSAPEDGRAPVVVPRWAGFSQIALANALALPAEC